MSIINKQNVTINENILEVVDAYIYLRQLIHLRYLTFHFQTTIEEAN